MEQLLIVQKERIQELQNLITNHGKANKERKSEIKYYEREIAKLDDWWLIFDDTNKDLTRHQVGNEEQPYFKEKNSIK